jgi:hypothetical protein
MAARKLGNGNGTARYVKRAGRTARTKATAKAARGQRLLRAARLMNLGALSAADMRMLRKKVR